MKTTIDLPDDLIREVKLRAVLESRKLKDVIEEIFRRGLAVDEPARSPQKRYRVPLPLITAPAGSRTFDLSGDRLLELEIEASRPKP